MEHVKKYHKDLEQGSCIIYIVIYIIIMNFN